MTTYRLPEVLGGGEFENLVEFLTKAGDQWRSRFDIPGVGLVDVPREALTEVVVLPEEPDIASVVLDRHDRAWQHLAFGGRGDWCCTVDDLGADWEELNREHGPLTRLVPESVVEPVTLPWKSHGVEVQQTSTDSGPGNHVHVSTKDASYGFAHLKPSVARKMACALNTAADAAERAS